MDDNRETEDALRASLERHARQAPRGDLLAERVILHAGEPQPARRPWVRWRTWALPVLASASVGAVVVGIAVASNLNDHKADQPPQTSRSVSVAPNQTSVSSPQPAPNGVNVAGALGFEVTDLTFYGEKEAWGLGTARCLSGAAGRCTAVVHTKDGVHWASMKGPAADVVGQCVGKDPCVSHIRFADEHTGYAFGPTAFFMTADSGQHWTQLPGGAEALETLDDNVIRVTSSSPSGCPGPCNLGIETSAIGSTKWTASQLPGGAPSVSSLRFARGNGGYAYLLAMRNPAGGAGAATSTLYRSKDSGATWTKGGEPCRPFVGQYSNSEADSIDVAGGANGRVAVLCLERSHPVGRVVAVSSNGGATFSTTGGKISGTKTILAGDPHTVLAAAGDDGLSRSTDGATTWIQVDGVTGPITFVGFESQWVGRAVGDNGSTIWTTHDGGITWTAFTFA